MCLVDYSEGSSCALFVVNVSHHLGPVDGHVLDGTLVVEQGVLGDDEDVFTGVQDLENLALFWSEAEGGTRQSRSRSQGTWKVDQSYVMHRHISLWEF